MFNKKRIIVFFVFILLMFFMMTFGASPVQNASVATREVIFTDGYDGKDIAKYTVEVGEDSPVPENPYHENYVFSGWFRFENHDIRVTDFKNILSNLHVIALYGGDINNNGIDDKVDTYFNVSFVNSINKSVIKEEKVLIGMDATAPNAPSMSGYTFGGWDKSYTNVRENLTVNTIYNRTGDDEEEEITTYNVTFVDGDTSETISVVTVNEGASATAPTPPTHEKRVFDHWEGNYSNVRNNETVTAIYGDDKNNNGENDDTEIKYSVRFESTGHGHLEAPDDKFVYTGLLKDLTFGESGVVIPTAVADQYYESKGWTKDNVNVTISSNTVVSDNVTYINKFGPINDENGNDIADETEYFDVKATANALEGQDAAKGTALPASQNIQYGKDADKIALTPDNGYTIKSLLVDNVEQTTEGESRSEFVTNGYTFTYVTADHELIVTFSEDRNGNNIPDDEEDHYTITTSVDGGNGNVNPSGDTDLIKGENLTVSFVPTNGYTIKSLLVDSEEKTTTGESRSTYVTDGYTFSNVEADHTLVVKYGKDENGNNIPDDEEKFTVTAEARALPNETAVNGSVDPTSQEVNYGSSATVAISPNDGFTIKSLLVDNTEQTITKQSRESFVTNGYTFDNVTDNHSLVVTFSEDRNDNNIPDDEEDHFTITTSASGNGTVTPDGETDVIKGENLTVTFAPEEGYTIKSLVVDGEELTTSGQSREAYINDGYTFSNIEAAHTLNVTFGKDENGNNIPDDEEKFTITAEAKALEGQDAAKGSVAPTSQTVNYGGTGTVTFTPNNGFTIKSLLFNNLLGLFFLKLSLGPLVFICSIFLEYWILFVIFVSSKSNKLFFGFSWLL